MRCLTYRALRRSYVRVVAQSNDRYALTVLATTTAKKPRLAPGLFVCITTIGKKKAIRT
jgi:hypothetical protein